MPRRLAPLVIVALLVGSFVGSVALVDPPMPGVGRTYPDPDPAPPPGPELVASGFTTFDSPADFYTYLNASRQRYAAHQHRQAADDATDPSASRAAAGIEAAPHRQPGARTRAIETTGAIATSDDHVFYAHGAGEAGKTSVIDITAVEESTVVGSVPRTGRVFRAGDALVVLGERTITGYDVSAPADPERAWNRSVTGDVVAAQSRDGAVFLVLSTSASTSACPVDPLEGVTTRCTDIYHPADPVPIDSIYTVVRLDPTSGRVQQATSLVGSRQSTVYTDEGGIYLTATEPTPRGAALLDFLLTDARSLLPIEVIGRLERVRGSKLSDRASYTAARRVLDEWLSSLSAAEQRVLDHRLDTRFRSYVAEHRRSLQVTHVVRLHEDTLAIAASGSVPGVPTGRSAFGERDGRLRVVTTVHPPRLRWGPVRATTGAYVLDATLDVIGSTTGLQYGQASMVELTDEAAIVGSRSTTSLQVVDLSDHEGSHPTGTVTLPTPVQTVRSVSPDRLLGVSDGDGDDRRAVALVDVSNPANPQIVAHRTLLASRTTLNEEPVAVLTTARRDVTVLRTGTTVRVLTTDDLSTVATVSVDRPRDAVAIDGHLYVFGRDEVVVVDTSTWAVDRRIPL